MKSNAASPHPHNVILKEPQATEGSKEILRCAQDDTTANDRLAIAKNFANELNESRLWKIKISYQKRWTARRRTQKRVEIQSTKPWQKSSGPKTPSGKMRTRLNARKHDPALQEMKHALRFHQRFLRAIDLYTRMRKCRHPAAEAFAVYCHHLSIAANHVLITVLLFGGHDFHPLIKISRVTS